MGNPTICIGENKGADQLCGNREADQRLCFCFTDSSIPLLSKSKFPVSSHLLCLYRPVCVRPVRKPHCWFSHEEAQLLQTAGNVIQIACNEIITNCLHCRISSTFLLLLQNKYNYNLLSAILSFQTAFNQIILNYQYCNLYIYTA